MKTVRISKSRLSDKTMAIIGNNVKVTNETDFAFDITGSPDLLKTIYSIIDPIQSRNPFIK